MKRLHMPLLVTLGFTSLTCKIPAADSPPLERALQQSLAFLKKEGVAWHEDKTCLSCHHIPFMVWTHLEAGRRGLSVDQARLQEWIGWCAEWAAPKGGWEVLAELVVMLPRPAVTSDAHARIFATLPAGLAALRKSDGSWEPSGQFRAQHWPAAEAAAHSAAWGIQALASTWADEKSREESRKSAQAWLKDSPAPQSTGSLVARLRLHQLLDDPGRVEALVKELLTRQKQDGGWSWRIEAEGSDPLMTGEVLHALNSLERPDLAEVNARAVAVLLRTQHHDGAWHQDHRRISANIRINDIGRIDSIYTYLATGWATMGLLATLPAVAPPSAGPHERS